MNERETDTQKEKREKEKKKKERNKEWQKEILSRWTKLHKPRFLKNLTVSPQNSKCTGCNISLYLFFFTENANILDFKQTDNMIACSAIGTPKPHLKILLDGVKLQAKDTGLVVFAAQQSGYYSCSAQSQAIDNNPVISTKYFTVTMAKQQKDEEEKQGKSVLPKHLDFLSPARSILRSFKRRQQTN